MSKREREKYLRDLKSYAQCLKYEREYERRSKDPTTAEYQAIRKSLDCRRRKEDPKYIRDCKIAEKIGVKVADVPATLFEAKRAQLKVKSLLKELSNG